MLINAFHRSGKHLNQYDQSFPQEIIDQCLKISHQLPMIDCIFILEGSECLLNRRALDEQLEHPGPHNIQSIILIIPKVKQDGFPFYLLDQYIPGQLDFL